MKKYEIKYYEGDTINKTTVIEAESAAIALYKFYMQNNQNTDVISIIEMKEVKK